jgi:hypothetical protein
LLVNLTEGDEVADDDAPLTQSMSRDVFSESIDARQDESDPLGKEVKSSKMLSGLTIGRTLGEGFYGSVHLASTRDSETVVVKKLKRYDMHVRCGIHLSFVVTTTTQTEHSLGCITRMHAAMQITVGCS